MTRSRSSKAVLVVALVWVWACGEQAQTSGASSPSTTSPSAAKVSIHSLTMRQLDGTPAPLSRWAGKVLLIVNTASECGLTPQYAALQALHAKYESRGFAVLGFPSNDFGGQEPGSASEIAAFCEGTYGVTFPMFDKVRTTGGGRSPLFAQLSSALGPPRWNFHKYLVDKHGYPLEAWSSLTTPDDADIAKAIEAALTSP